MNTFLLCVCAASIILLINYIYCLFYSVGSYSDEELEKEAIENTVQYMNEHMEKYNYENTKLETDNYNVGLECGYKDGYLAAAKSREKIIDELKKENQNLKNIKKLRGRKRK